MMRFITLTWLVLLFCLSMYGQTVDSGSTGVDGPFNPPGQVPAGTLVQGDCTSPPGCTVLVPLREPPNHVFNFTTITVGPRITVKFRRNAANTPVFILAQGNVTINGVIDVSGDDSISGLNATKGGPGGFGGGVGSITGSPTGQGGAGSGPGGGGGQSTARSPGAGAGFGTEGQGYLAAVGGAAYGTPELRLIIGGSGGGGGGEAGGSGLPECNGGGGAGGLLIASSGIIELGGPRGNVNVRANGGGSSCGLAGGSGGAVRLVATTLRGIGTIQASGSSFGATGRIRMESFRFEFTGSTGPQYTWNQPGPNFPIFPPITPTLRVVSIGGVPMPAQPTYDISTPDVTLPESVPNPVTIVLEATNVASGTQAKVILAPQLGSGARVITSPVALTGTAGQPKRGMISVTVPRGMGVISAIIDTAVPEP